MIYALFCFTNNIHIFTIVKNHSTVPIHQEGAQDQIYYSHMAQDINSKVGNSWSCFKTRRQDKTKSSSQFWAISAKQALLSTQTALHPSNWNNLNAEPWMLDKHHQINTSSILITGDEGVKWWLYDLRLWDWLLSSNHSSCPTRWSLYWPLLHYQQEQVHIQCMIH